MAWILAEASKDWKQSDLDISGTTKALRNFEIVYLLDNGIFGALGTSPSISTDYCSRKLPIIYNNRQLSAFVQLMMLEDRLSPIAIYHSAIDWDYRRRYIT